jgi:hypothetical protein
VVGVINRAASPEHVAPILTNGLPYDNLKGIPQLASVKTLDFLEKELNQLKRFELVNLDNPGFTKDPRVFASSAFTDVQIDSICRLYELDGILALDGLEMAIRTSGDVDVVTVNDPTGMPVRVPEFSKESQVDLTVLWRFYNCGSGQRIDEYQETYQRFFSRIAYSEEEIGELKPEDMRLVDIAYLAAKDYHDRISPHWVEDYRRYYTSGSPELLAIQQELMITGNWESAAMKWKELAQSNDPKTKYRSMFNMAVASELFGKPRVAKEWIEKAISVNPSRKAIDYKKEIEKQVLIYEVVNSQLGIN